MARKKGKGKKAQAANGGDVPVPAAAPARPQSAPPTVKASTKKVPAKPKPVKVPEESTVEDVALNSPSTQPQMRSPRKRSVSVAKEPAAVAPANGSKRARGRRRDSEAASPKGSRGNGGAGEGGGRPHKTQAGGEGTGMVFASRPDNQEELGIDDLQGGLSYMEAVVKVFCTHTEPNFSLPWQRKRQFSSTSTGFAIGGRRLLTNAHSVDHHTQVKVKRRGSDTKFVAKVLAIGIECDLALLVVEEDEFWEGMPHVCFGQLPWLQDSVLVVGYPIGGDTVSVTSGVVSRIEVTSYVHGSAELLGVQIDAAINSGNSGGPVFNGEGDCVGVAFQSMKHDDAENIGYIIPTPVIEHFINDYERNGAYTGFPTLGIEWQRLENPHLRASLGMKKDAKGVLLCRIEPAAPSFHAMRKEDILVSFDGVAIANDGTVPFRQGERIGFSYLVSQKYTNEEAKLEIMSKGKLVSVSVRLQASKRLVPVHIRGESPSYLIVAGLVFTAVTVPYLRSEYGKEYEYDAPVKLLDKMMHGKPETPGEEIVVLSQVLAADVNIGYEDIVNTQVVAFNKTPITKLEGLAQLVHKCKDKFLRFDLEYNQTVVLDAKEAKATTPEILATHCIPSPMSENLQKAVRGGKA